jgi:hypothetical protein
MRRSPKGRQHPAVLLRIYPTRHGTPDARTRKVHLFVADQRSAIKRRLVILSARVLSIQKIHAAFLARGGHQLVAIERKNRGRHLKIQIALLQPRPVQRHVVILEM